MDVKIVVFLNKIFFTFMEILREYYHYLAIFRYSPHK